MLPFLKQTAGYLLETYPNELSGICVVLPNRRAGLFLRKYLAEGLAQPVWSPAIYSIEDFLAHLAGLNPVEPVWCLMELYEVYKEAEKEKAQPFGEFLNWGEQLLGDFNEIDSYLADPEALFSYLDEARAISQWNLNHEPLTDFQKQYLHFYRSLFRFYAGLKGRLLKKNMGYQGLIFRRAWERLESNDAPVHWKKILFAGFNALTTAEEKIIDFLVKAGTADLFWDADKYYLDDSGQEAGEFLRSWFRRWPAQSSRWVSDLLQSGQKRIGITGVPGNVGQVRLCGEMLQTLQEQNESLDERIAIILPDESLLLPLLNSLPAGLQDVNITMGLPLRMIPLTGLLESVFRMHLRMHQQEGKVRGFYYRDVLQILRHPFLIRMAATLMEGSRFIPEEVTGRIQQGNVVFPGKEQIMGAKTDLFSAGLGFLDPIFDQWTKPLDAIAGMQKLIETIVMAIRQDIQSSGKESAYSVPSLDLEYAYALAGILNQLHAVIETYPENFRWETVNKFFRQLLGSASLPFYGEPLKGIQIMGMLESRTLDFHTVIILSCNEGVLPSGRSIRSFIPFDIRHDFHLPTYRHKDAVYAYHFYRIMQRASDVRLIYNTEPDVLAGGDPSRFIRQIVRELPPRNPEIIIHETVLSAPVKKSQELPGIAIPKQGDVKEKLLEKAVKGLAPTALNAFRICPLRFYYSEIAGLREPEETEDEIDPKTLGSAVHEALHQLFKPVEGKTVSSGDIRKMASESAAVVEKAFTDTVKGATISHGKNLLLFRVGTIMVQRFLRMEADLLEKLAREGETLQVVILEHPLHRGLDVGVNGSVIQVKLKGFIDRMDIVAGVKRIIDYKTGSVVPGDIKLAEWEKLPDDSALDKTFQLLMYAWLVNSDPAGLPLQSGIYSMKKLSQGFIGLKVAHPEKGELTENLDHAILNKVESILTALLAEIFDLNKPFVQTSDPGLCQRCPYINVCGR